MRVICHANQPPDRWDERLYAAEAEAGLCQSTYWARVIQRVDQALPLFVAVYDDLEIVASLMLLHKIPWDRHAMRKKHGIMELISGTLRGWLEWMDGPVLYYENEAKAKEALGTLLAWIEAYASKRQLPFIRSFGFAHTSRWAADEDIAQIFAKYGYKRNYWSDLLVDLTPDEEDLWMRISHSSRKMVKRARKMGVCVQEIRSSDEFESKFYIPYRDTETASGRKANPLCVEQMPWEEDRDGYYRFYIAESPEGRVFGTLGMYIFNGVAIEIASCLTSHAFEQKIPAQDILHWEMFLEAKKAGCHTFDMAGVNPNPQTQKEKGIYQFKKKWGGRYVEYYTYEKSMMSWLKKMVKEAKSIKQIIRKLCAAR